jgi:hypothetical protein
MSPTPLLTNNKSKIGSNGDIETDLNKKKNTKVENHNLIGNQE